MKLGLVCRWVEGMLPGFEAGALPEWRFEVVARHLGDCPQCRACHRRQMHLAEQLRGSASVRCDLDTIWSGIAPDLVRVAPVPSPIGRRAFAASGAVVLIAGVVMAGKGMAPSAGGNRVPVAVVPPVVSQRTVPIATANTPVRRVEKPSQPEVVGVRTANRDPFAHGGEDRSPAPVASLPRVVRADLRLLIRESAGLAVPPMPVPSGGLAQLDEPSSVSPMDNGEQVAVGRPEPDFGDIPIDSTDRASRAFQLPEHAALRTVAVRDLFR